MKTSTFQQLIESVENLSIEDQEVLLDILQKRLQQKRRAQIAKEITEVRQEVEEGNFQVGSVDQFLQELDQL